MTFDTPQEDSDVPTGWQVSVPWWAIVVISVALLLVTLNPLLAGFLPYINAGWPAAKTAFWLKSTDPWKARGTVGWLFHLCMALFRAGASGFLWIVVTAIVVAITQEKLDLIPFAIAIGTITFGCFLSTILCWIGVAIALGHGTRVFVASRLYKICRGDFTEAQTLEFGPGRTNPGNYIIAVATATPMLAMWFVAMMTTMPGPLDHEDSLLPLLVLCLLPVLAMLCIAVVI